MTILFVVVPRAGIRSATPAVIRWEGTVESRRCAFVGRSKDTVGVGIVPICEALTRVGVCTCDTLLDNHGVGTELATVDAVLGVLVSGSILFTGASENGG